MKKYKYIYICSCNAGDCHYDSYAEYIGQKYSKFCGINRKIRKKRKHNAN
jgi:hypothetical protein